VTKNINTEWQEIKNTTIQTAREVLGMRMKRYKRKRLVKWDEEISNLILEEKQAI
jgi:hypothetical protein